MKRLFVAVEVQISESFQALLINLKQTLCLDKVVWVDDKLHHLTLRFLGQTPEPFIPPLKQALAKLTADNDAFSMEMNRLGVFGSKHSPQVIWLGFQDFEPFRQLFLQLEPQLLAIGFEPNYGNFVPHLTLGRIKQIQNKKRFWELVTALQPKESQTVYVDSLLLIQSRLTPQGPIYRVLERYPLRKEKAFVKE